MFSGSERKVERSRWLMQMIGLNALSVWMTSVLETLVMRLQTSVQLFSYPPRAPRGLIVFLLWMQTELLLGLGLMINKSPSFNWFCDVNPFGSHLTPTTIQFCMPWVDSMSMVRADVLRNLPSYWKGPYTSAQKQSAPALLGRFSFDGWVHRRVFLWSASSSAVVVVE